MLPKRLVRQCYLAQYVQAQETFAKIVARAWMLIVYCFVSVVVAAESAAAQSYCGSDSQDAVVGLGSLLGRVERRGKSFADCGRPNTQKVVCAAEEGC